MFEEEVAMEKRSNIVPLLLIVALVLAIVSGVTWIVLEAKKKLTPEQASAIISDVLKAQGPAVVHFHAGLVKPSVDEKPRDPHYRLLQKVGILKVTNAKDNASFVMVTDAGKQQLERFPALQKGKNPDNSEFYTAPLATRQLVKIDGVTMKGSTVALVEYQWKWKPNELGRMFDASSSAVKSFNTWDRATLIQKYGVNFYNGDPQKASLTLVRTDSTWKIAAE